MRTLNHWVNDTQDALGRRARINVWYRPKDERTLIPPPMTEEQVIPHIYCEGRGPDIICRCAKSDLIAMPWTKSSALTGCSGS